MTLRSAYLYGLTADMSATEITVAKASNKIREDWMYAEQNLKMAIMRIKPVILFIVE
jgi:hypothetical protein